VSPRRRGGNADQNGGAGGGPPEDADGSFDDDLDDDEVSALDEVSQDDVEQLEEGVDVDSLDEEELVSLDDAARALLAKPRRGHGPIARLYRGETRFDFVGRRKIWFSLSSAIIVLGIITIILRGGLNLGIEFKGGTEWTIAAPGVTQTQATDAMKGTGVIDPTVELLGTGSKQTLNVQSDLNKLSQDQQNKVSQNVQAAMLKLTAAHAPPTPPTTTTTVKPTTTTTKAATAGPTTGSSTTAPTTTSTTATTTSTTVPADKISITTVGPTWGSSITNKAIEALIIFFIVVAIYISFRFEPKMALAAFIAMIHDVLVAIGIYSIFGFQVTPDTVVAILTILGYSLYDTVVVFDRVRDNTRGIGSSGRMTYPQLINLSMNQTLARSINTSAVAIIPVLAILVIGAQILGATTLQSYGLALFIGLLSGAYSSIFIASPVLCMMKQREARWVAIAKRQHQRGEDTEWFSAVDAAHMSTQMSLAAAGQVSRAAGGGSATQRSASTKRSGPIRPGSGNRPPGGGAGGGAAGTATMDRGNGSGSGNSTGVGKSAAASASASASAGASASGPAPGPRPRKGKSKRKRR
jgi:preprotein translocase subunit SecF